MQSSRRIFARCGARSVAMDGARVASVVRIGVCRVVELVVERRCITFGRGCPETLAPLKGARANTSLGTLEPSISSPSRTQALHPPGPTHQPSTLNSSHASSLRTACLSTLPEWLRAHFCPSRVNIRLLWDCPTLIMSNIGTATSTTARQNTFDRIIDHCILRCPSRIQCASHIQDQVVWQDKTRHAVLLYTRLLSMRGTC